MFLGSIITIILFELFFETPYKRLKYEIKNSLNRLPFQNKLISKSCNLEEVFSLPYNSTVIIGHAYGSKELEKGYISKNRNLFEL